MVFHNYNLLFYRELVFEKAYCQYRLNQPHDALKTLNAATSLSSQLKELKAQILYRLERYFFAVTVATITAIVMSCSVEICRHLNLINVSDTKNVSTHTGI